MSWAEWAEAKNAKTRTKGRWRKLADFDAIGPTSSLTEDCSAWPQSRLLRLQRLFQGSPHTQRCLRRHTTR